MVALGTPNSVHRWRRRYQI